MGLTKTPPNNILSPDGNSFAVFLDINSPQVLKLKDINGNIDLLSKYLTPSGTFIVSMENVGAGAGLYIPSTINPAQLKTLVQGSNVVITESAQEIEISVPTTVVGQVGLYSQTAPSTAITNTTVPTSLINGGVGTLSVPANGFQVGDSFVAYFSGEISSKNNETIQIRLNSNGVTLGDTGLLVLNATTNKFWEMSVNFTVRTIGGTGVAAIMTSGRFTYNKNSANIPEGLGFNNLNNTTFSTTINNTLAVTAQWGSADVLNSIRTEIFNLYRVY